MHFDFYGLGFETPHVTFYLWSPWRAAHLEHRLFSAIGGLPNAQVEEGPDELRIQLKDVKTCRAAVQAVARVLKGWQEEAEPGSERRAWRWLLEADTDHDGYDHAGEPTCIWGFIRVSLERGGPGEPDKGEDIDLQGFGLQIASEKG
jgi:hypothetical protein